LQPSSSRLVTVTSSVIQCFARPAAMILAAAVVLPLVTTLLQSRGPWGHRRADRRIFSDMDDEIRRLRGLVGVGTTWGVAWAVIGALIGLVIGIVSPGSVAGSVVEWALGLGAYGLVSGVGFGGLLAYHESRKTVTELSPGRAALWGVLGAVLVPLLFGLLGFFEIGTTPIDVLEAMAVTAALGGTFAAGSVAIARAARGIEAGDVNRLEAGESAALLEPARTEEPDFQRARARRTERR
jgi:hypothetical protein